MTLTIPDRQNIPENHQWDLSPLFQSDEKWELLFAEIEKEMPRYDSYRGRLAESISVFKEAIEFDLGLSRNLEKLFTYAHLKSDEDKSNQRYLGFHQRALNLYTRSSELSSFITPEIQSIPASIMDVFLRDPGLAEYRFYLEKILRYRPHTLSPEIEQIIAMSGEMSHAASEIFSQLDNADITFGSLTDETGKEVELSHGNFITFLQNRDRGIREKAFFQYYRSYDSHKNTIAAALHYSNKRDCFYSRVRRFENCRRASLFSDDISDEVYDNLIDTVRKNLSPLFRYLDFRKKALCLEELHIYDTYVPMIGTIPFSMSYEEAVDTSVAACAPLGPEYTGTLAKGLLSGWVDRYENRGKRSGAYSSGCYDSPPYILLNYRDDNINSLYTLIHEAGHSMHSWYSNRHQPYVYHDYTIFVAEVASTFNEFLLSHHLLFRYKDDAAMTAYILNREIDNIRGTLFRQCMFAEFEKLSHRHVEENRPLTLEELRRIYRGLLQTYFGGTMTIDDELTLECLRIPHFYSPFYVYKYATGISAAISLARNVLEKGDPARNAYLAFLRLGGSRFPLDELREAGVDMSVPEPVESAIRYFSDCVDRFISIYDGLQQH
ncbi:MAG: oligoendopeptidase F [Spirochaetes bacterium]|nr:oligoendopeptidase F [Spirochaetota bacterium]